VKHFLKLFGKDLLEIEGRESNKYKNICNNGVKYCIWCGRDLEGGKRKFCSDICKERFWKEWEKRFCWSVIAYNLKIEKKWTCEKCGVKDYGAEVHHIIPRCEGGTDNKENLIVLCRKCHREETNKLIRKIKKEEKELKLRGFKKSQTTLNQFLKNSKIGDL